MKLKSNDIRLGSWVLWQNVPMQVRVYEIEIQQSVDNNTLHENHGVYGLSLTPNILTKSGFDARDASDEGYLGSIFTLIHMVGDKMDYFTLVKDKDEYQFEFYYDESSKIRAHRPLRYVHELQNLYFALYGEELNIVI
jgi:hypothetical protein